MPFRRAGPLALVLLLLPAAAMASWSPSPTAHTEPSHPADDPDYLRFDPHVGAGEKLYFSGELAPAGGDPSMRRFVAYLGYWKDCNRDGYIGILGEDDYPPELLTAHSLTLCPASGAHRADGRVREFLWVGPGSHDVDVPGVKVWSDWGFPWTSPPAWFSPRRAPDDVLTFHPDAVGPKWIGPTVWLSSATGDLRPGPATHFAYVPPGLVESGSLPGGSAWYGGPFCPHGGMGWDCDDSNWVGPVKVYDPYNLRDVDCHDFSQPGGTC